MKRVIVFVLAVFVGLFFDLTLPARKALANFLVKNAWGGEFSVVKGEMERDEMVVQCNKECEERGEMLHVLQRELTDLSSALRAAERLPHAWHRDVAPGERRPVRLGREITKTPPRHLSSLEAAKAIVAATANLPEPPPEGEMDDREAQAWANIAQIRAWAQAVLEGRHLVSARVLVVQSRLRHRHHRTKK
jgi:hypothetical protein